MPARPGRLYLQKEVNKILLFIAAYIVLYGHIRIKITDDPFLFSDST